MVAIADVIKVTGIVVWLVCMVALFLTAWFTR